jgi:hypothetical protein
VLSATSQGIGAGSPVLEITLPNGHSVRVALPTLLVDFDGVLNPFAATSCPPGFTEYGLDEFPGEDPVRLNPAHARWLGDLAPFYDMAWASACPEDLNLYCERLIQLAPMSRVPMPQTPFDPDDKVGAVDTYVGVRPVAWLDDAFGDAARQWASGRAAPTLLVDVDPAVGLTLDLIQVLATWQASLTTP